MGELGRLYREERDELTGAVGNLCVEIDDADMAAQEEELGIDLTKLHVDE